MLKRLKHPRLWIVGVIIVVLALLYYSSGYFFIYNNDAYVDADWIKVTPVVSGPISSVPVKDNQFVKKGSLLLALESRPFEIAVNQARANLQKAIAQRDLLAEKIHEAAADIEVQEAKLKLAKTTWQRYSDLFKKQAISKQTFEQQVEILNVAEAELTKAQQVQLQTQKELAVSNATIADERAILSLSEYKLSKSQLLAPSDGYTNNMSVYAGDYAESGKTLFSFIKDKTWRVVANIKETNLVGLKPGQLVWIYLSSRPWHFYRGKIESIGRGVARSPTPPDAGLPYVKPVTNWIRYAYRIPVRISFVNLPKDVPLHIGTDARVILFR